MIVCPPPGPPPGTTTQEVPRVSRPGATSGAVRTTGTERTFVAPGAPNTTGQGPPAQGASSTAAAPAGDGNTLLQWAAQFVDRSDPRFSEFFEGSSLNLARYSSILTYTVQAAYSIQWRGNTSSVGGNPIGGYPIPPNAGDIILLEFNTSNGHSGDAWYFPSPDPGKSDSPPAFNLNDLKSQSPVAWPQRAKNPAIGGRVAVYPSGWFQTPRPVAISSIFGFISPPPDLVDQTATTYGVSRDRAFQILAQQVGGV